jgi:hypothetical protein
MTTEMEMTENKERSKVRVEAVDTSCGSTGHMTADEIKGRSIGAEVNLACPECGEIHLTPEDACEAAARKISESLKYHKIKAEAELEKK